MATTVVLGTGIVPAHRRSELERTVTYVEQLLDDTDREMAGAATS